MPTSPAPTVGASAPPKIPSTAGIWIGVLVIVAGVVLGIVLVISGVRSLVDGFDQLQRVSMSSGGTVRIETAGTQSVYAERFSASSGGGFSTSTGGFTYGPNIHITVTDPSGNPVFVRPATSSETYTYHQREGVRIGQFDADQPGSYQVSAVNSDDNTGYSTLAVGQAFDPGGIVPVLGGVFGGGLVVVIGIVLVIVFSVRRGRAKRRVVAASLPGPFGGYGFAAAGAPMAGWAAPPIYGQDPGSAGPAGGSTIWAPPPAAGPTPGQGWAPPPAPSPPQQQAPPFAPGPPPQAPPYSSGPSTDPTEPPSGS